MSSIIAIALIAVLGLLPAYTGWFNHDVGWLLYLAEQLLRGADIYSDFIEVNPPLVIWLNLPPVVLAGGLGLEPHKVHPAYVAILGLGSLALCRGLLRSSFADKDRFRYIAWVALALVFFALPGYSFGQREHFALLLSTPYVLAAAFNPPGWPAQLGWRADVIAFLGGVGFAVKPHFLMVWIAIELTETRSIAELLNRRRNWIVAGVLVVYAGATLSLEPDYVGIVGDLFRAYANFPVRPWYAGILHERTLATSFLLIIAVVACRLCRCIGDRAVRVGGAAALAYLFVAVIQNAGWAYHYLPAKAVTILLVLYCAYRILPADRCESDPKELSARNVSSYVLLACVGAIGLQLFADAGLALRKSTGLVTSPQRELRRAVHTYTDPGDSFAGLATYVSASFPLVNEAGLEWTVPYPSLWWIRALYASAADVEDTLIEPRTPGEMGEPEKSLYRRTIRELSARPAGLLLIASPQTNAAHSGFKKMLDLETYFGQDSVFRSLMEEYRQVASIDGIKLFARTVSSGSGRSPD